MPSPLTCSRCGQEVRWGTRHGRLAWWHREDVDHAVVLGVPSDPEETKAAIEAVRARAAEKGAKKKLEEEFEEEEEDADVVLDAPEVRSIPLPERGRLLVSCPDGSVAVAAVPGGARTILNLAAKTGWTPLSLNYSRGPYMGASMKVLGISDFVVLKMRGPVVDGRRLHAVASWRDNKSDNVWLVEGREVRPTTAKSLMALMKEVAP